MTGPNHFLLFYFTNYWFRLYYMPCLSNILASEPPLYFHNLTFDLGIPYKNYCGTTFYDFVMNSMHTRIRVVTTAIIMRVILHTRCIPYYVECIFKIVLQLLIINHKLIKFCLFTHK